MRLPLTGLPAVLLAVLLVGVSGCALLDGKDRLGTLLVSWSQADDSGIVEFAPDGTVVLADATARDRFLAAVADRRGHDEQSVARVDMRRYFLVLGSYPKCTEESRIWADGRRTTVWFEVYVPREDRRTVCAWAPVTIDFWRLPRSEFEPTPIDRLRTAPPG
jgi:hypothetical protein